MNLVKSGLIALSTITPAAKANAQVIAKDSTKVVKEMIANPVAAKDSTITFSEARKIYANPEKSYGINYYTASRMPDHTLGISRQVEYKNVKLGAEAIGGIDKNNKDFLLKGNIRANILDIDEGINIDFNAGGHGHIGKHAGEKVGGIAGEIGTVLACRKQYPSGVKMKADIGIGAGINMPYAKGDFGERELRLTPRIDGSIEHKHFGINAGVGIDPQLGEYARIGAKYVFK